MDCTVKSIGIIGLGAFGLFMVRHLSNKYRVLGYDPRPISMDTLHSSQAESLTILDFPSVCQSDVVIYAVPLSSLEEVVIKSIPYLKPNSLVLDVTSVKIKPIEIMLKHLPSNVDILATHPLFGPQSGKDSIVSLKIALCPVRIKSDKYYQICDYLSRDLKLSVLRVTAEEHDQEMAKVQAVTHFVSRALKSIGLEPSPMSTKGYSKLQEFSSTVLSDSWDLFLTIQNGNPYAADIRRALLSELTKLEQSLS